MHNSPPPPTHTLNAGRGKMSTINPQRSMGITKGI